MRSPEAKAHPLFKEAFAEVSERMRNREAITFTDDQGPDGREEQSFEHGVHEGRTWSDVAERFSEF